MVKFSELKKSSSDIDRLTQAIDKINNPKSKSEKVDDPRFWQPTVDDAGNGYAVIRFLPSPPVDGDEGMPWVRYFSHGFQGPSGSWYIENSLTTLGLKDPVGEENSRLWNTGLDSDKEIARERKRKLSYISNVYIVEDKANPENEGTVRLFRYGKKIFDKINEAMNPQFADEAPVNPFDLWNGANFKLKIRKVGDFRNYDKSEFTQPNALLSDDDKLEKIWKSEYSLKEFLDPSNFKSYDELKKRFEAVIGVTENVSASSFRSTDDEDSSFETDTNTESDSDSDKHTLDYFKNLANED